MATRKQTAAADTGIDDKVVDAALALAAERNWTEISLQEIAGRAEVPLADLLRRFGGKGAILRAFGRRVDARVLNEALDLDEPVRDRLFDLLMRRFEALQPHRRAVANILHDMAREPLSLFLRLPQLGRSMAWTLEAAGVSSDGWRGRARVRGLALIYLSALRVWLRDESEDLSATMAAVDKGLRRADQVLGLCRRLPRPRRTFGQDEGMAAAG